MHAIVIKQSLHIYICGLKAKCFHFGSFLVKKNKIKNYNNLQVPFAERNENGPAFTNNSY